MPSEPRFELFRDSADEWRWRLVASNEEIIATCGEGFSSKQGAERNIASVKEGAPHADVVIESRPD
ncbi:MAG: YegP family protein [Halodesulfurarchaeum sp.]